ncbi:heavy metal transporter [Coxiella burnetii]|uniref:CbuK_1976 family Dot/Icm T4SS effector n=1 Tax=Coxiella burnetii TaxID=777 RepID=UPI0003A7AA71|nr:CbuK_1976 family Dot/Icm T4SS effector [Coxiella burnetii]AML47961.1 heavy metal transporter [Coxiella burnetii]AML53988.1 heavy metal transporter [Coxiella burnetii]ATN67948.1 heavy metal transporter [Coxiella burnetii]ATN69875.1 heavy metal transporter [Coxiella burnetii]ATN71835.1 heavy metal transporter [Coxiella burnetii]
MRHENPHYSNEIKFDDSEQNKKMKKRKISPEERKAKHKATEAQRRERISESFDALFQSLSKKDTEVSDLKRKKVKKEIKTEKEIKILNLACITIEDLKKKLSIDGKNATQDRETSENNRENETKVSKKKIDVTLSQSLGKAPEEGEGQTIRKQTISAHPKEIELRPPTVLGHREKEKQIRENKRRYVNRLYNLIPRNYFENENKYSKKAQVPYSYIQIFGAAKQYIEKLRLLVKTTENSVQSLSSPITVSSDQPFTFNFSNQPSSEFSSSYSLQSGNIEPESPLSSRNPFRFFEDENPSEEMLPWQEPSYDSLTAIDEEEIDGQTRAFQ